MLNNFIASKLHHEILRSWLIFYWPISDKSFVNWLLVHPFIYYYECESSSSQVVETSQTPRKIDLRMINQRKFKILLRKNHCRFTDFMRTNIIREWRKRLWPREKTRIFAKNDQLDNILTISDWQNQCFWHIPESIYCFFDSICFQGHSNVLKSNLFPVSNVWIFY